MGRVRKGERIIDRAIGVISAEGAKHGGVPPVTWTARAIGCEGSRGTVHGAYQALVEAGRLIQPWGAGNGYVWVPEG